MAWLFHFRLQVTVCPRWVWAHLGTHFDMCVSARPPAKVNPAPRKCMHQEFVDMSNCSQCGRGRHVYLMLLLLMKKKIFTVPVTSEHQQTST